MLNAAPTDLTGKVCLVTGAEGGIGLAADELFPAPGAQVFATDVGAALKGLAQNRAFDLLSNAVLQDTAAWISESKADILFNNAALFDTDGTRANVAPAATFPTAVQSSYMTSQTIGVDGGNVLR